MNLKEIVDAIFVFIDTMQPIDSDIIVYRGSSDYDHSAYRFNRELSEVDFTNNTSTSTTQSSSTRFTREIAYEILVPKGTLILWVGLLEGENSYENEVLLPPAKFKILESKEGWVEHYKLEMMELLDYGQLMINQLKKLKKEAQEEVIYETFSKKNKDNNHIKKVAEIEELILYVQAEIYKRNCNAIPEVNIPIAK